MKKIVSTFILLLTLTISAQEISVLTYNIKYDEPSDTINGWNVRKDFLISQINYNQPDIFGTQEGMYNQLTDIKKGLDGYDFFGVGRDFGDTRGEYTAIFYNTKKVILIEESTFWLSETPDKPSKGWDAALNRICTYGIFEIKNSKKRLLVFNTHFDHIGEQARAESALLILKKAAEINRDNLPVIIMGDFNLEQDSQGVQNILKQFDDSHLTAKTSFGPTGTFNGFHFDKPVTRRIDFVFTSKNLEALKSGILSDSKDCRYPSDHFPVYVELNLKNE